MTRGIAWQIDDPAADVSRREQNVRQGRLHFFEKLGDRILDTPYFQPPVDGHTLGFLDNIQYPPQVGLR